MDADQLKAFAARLKDERKRLDLTRSALCLRAAITRTTLRHLEKGVQQPTQDTIEKLARALQLPAAVLTGEKRFETDHPLLKGLREEDLEIAQLFHHASTDVRLAVRNQLRGDADDERVNRFLDRLRQRLLADPADLARMELGEQLEADLAAAQPPQAAHLKPTPKKKPSTSRRRA